MSLLSLVFLLIVIGVCLHLLNRFGGKYIDGEILNIINIVVIVAVILFILSLFFSIGSLQTIHIGK